MNKLARTFLLFVPCVVLAVIELSAQVPDAAPPAPPAVPPVSGASGMPALPPGTDPGVAAAASSMLSRDVPFLDPGGEMLAWDGKHWNVNNNRIFGARFEKYLNADAETNANAAKYRQIVLTILTKLSPYHLSPAAMDEAYKLLPQASSFEADAGLSDALASSIYSVWQSRRENDRVAQADKSMDEERRKVEWNARITSANYGGDQPPNSNASKAEQEEWTKNQNQKRDLQMAPYLARMAEIKTLTAAHQASRELGQLQSKVEFQALIVQFFLQRRFQHVLMATQFYRAVFGEGDTSLKVGDEAKKLFSQTTGMPPTVTVLDSLAKEAMRDSREGVEAYKFLLGKNELESATKRLAEAFAVGEYLPELRTLPRDGKRQALEFTQKSNQLISALDVKDYTLAAKLVRDLEVTARDFDNSKPMAAIETARTVAAMHLAKAKNAAVANDRVTLEIELRQATEIWPRNPALSELSTAIFSQADVQQKALTDFDQLLSQHNYRQIFDDKMRYIAAVAMSPDRQESLKKVLDDMTSIETAILRAQEVAKHGDFAGAWETVETVFKQFPDDNKLNQVRASLTTEAANFVRTLRTAEGLEAKQQYGSSLAWYLKAQQIYPASTYASEAVGRLVKEVLPEG